MTSIRREIHINKPQAAVWSKMANLGNIMDFHPIVNKSYYVTEQEEGIGAGRVCELDNMNIQETTIDWKEGEYYTVEVEPISGQAPPMTNIYGTLGVNDNGDGTSTAYMTINYTMKYGPVGWLLDHLMVRSTYTKMVEDTIAGLKHHSETGQLVDLSVLKELDAKISIVSA